MVVYVAKMVRVYAALCRIWTDLNSDVSWVGTPLTTAVDIDINIDNDISIGIIVAVLVEQRVFETHLL